MINRKKKGNRGELEWANFCKKKGFDVKRSQQYCGTSNSADCIGLPGIHQEIKYTEKLRIYDALSQAKKDSSRKNFPIVAHRKKRQKWVIVMDANNWFELYKKWLEVNELYIKK